MSTEPAPESEPTVEDEEVVVPPSEWEKLNVKLLEVINTAQTQHGMRRTVPNYSRYRKFTTEKLRRLRKGTRFLHSGRKGRFKARKMKPGVVKSPSHLLIVAFQAERAWAHSHELKTQQEMAGDETTRLRWHSLKKLRKAAAFARQLVELCEVRADEGTLLEAKAYSSWLQGVLYGEEIRWREAVQHLAQAHLLFSRLGEVGSEARKAVLRARLEATEPLLTYARYRLGAEGGAPEGDVGDAELEAFLERNRKEEAENADSLVWRGHSVTVRSSRLKSALVDVKFAQYETERGDIGARVQAFDSLLTALSELTAQSNSNKVVTAWASEQVHHHTLRRFECMIELAHAVIDGSTTSELLGDNLQYVDVVALYDQLIQSAGAQRTLFEKLSEGFPDTDMTLDNRISAAAEVLFQSGRHLAIANHYQAIKRWSEALAVILRSHQLGEEALESLLQLGDSKADPWVAKARKTVDHVQAQRALVQARAYEASAGASEGPQVPSNTLLMNRLDTVVPPDHPAALKLAAIPPPASVVPVKPVVFDVAGAYIKYPSIEARTKSKGFFSSLWGT